MTIMQDASIATKLGPSNSLGRSQDTRALLLLMGVFVLFYFSALSGFSLSIDDELNAVNSDPVAWASQGRWLLYLINSFVIPQPTLVFFPLFFFGICCSVGYLFIAKAHHIGLNDFRTYLLFVLFCGFPTIFHMTNFAANTVGRGIGLVASSTAAYLFALDLDRAAAEGAASRWKVGSFLGQAALIAIAIGAYQSVVLFAFATYLGLVLHRMVTLPTIPLRAWVAWHAWIAAVLVSSALLSEIAGYSLRVALGVSLAYVGDFLRPELLVSDPAGVFRRSFESMWRVYAGSAQAFGYSYVAIPALILVGLAALAVQASRPTKWWPIVPALYSFGVLASPFVLNLLTGGLLPLRSLLGVPYAVFLVATFAVFSRSSSIRSVGLVLTAAVALQSLYAFSALQSAKRLQFDRDQELAFEIYKRAVGQIENFDRAKSYELDVYGGLDFPSIYPIPPTSTFGASFFGWDGGNPRRVVAVMEVLGYPNFIMVSRENRQRTVPEMLSMPVWPHPESVKFSKGVILVKLGDRPSRAYSAAIQQVGTRSTAGVFWRLNPLSKELRVANARIQEKTATQLSLSAGRDVQLAFVTGKPVVLRSCKLLEITGAVQVSVADSVQLFFRTSGELRFSEQSSSAIDIGVSGATSRIRFVVPSVHGFEDSFRLDPVRVEQASKVSELALRCLVNE